jgi:hypothetical protein
VFDSLCDAILQVALNLMRPRPLLSMAILGVIIWFVASYH